jgi:arylsulfatase A-like enzyme
MVYAMPDTLLLLLLTAWQRDPVYQYLSLTLPLTLLVDTSAQERITSIDWRDDLSLNGCSTLRSPPPFDWLPYKEIAGFGDWYQDVNSTGSLHYDPLSDCFHVSNLREHIIEPIRSSILGDRVKIKHVIFIIMESAREDVFPLTRDSGIWKRIVETYTDHQIPAEIASSLGYLSKNARYLTDTIPEPGQDDSLGKRRGAIVASDAYTTSSYTLKSMTGTLCGIEPLTADFNQEYKHHIYQPCIGHILGALNQQITRGPDTEDFTSWPWQSTWMQSVTEDFDHQEQLITNLGFNKSVTRTVLLDPNAPHYPPKSKDINYFGLPERELKPYLRDALEDAERKQERLFLTHLTSSTHHPWALPKDFLQKQYLGSNSYGYDRKFNRYLNTIGLVDDWLGEIISVLEETGVADETLLVLSGDHGLSMPDDRGSTYENAHASNFHIPLVISHAGLDSVQIDTPVSAKQLLPTLFDLLISSRSLDEASEAAASDLLPLYEGQSLLRPMHNFSKAGRRVWHYSIVNPGGSWLAMRSTTESFRLAVPLVAELGWRFTNLADDPGEENPIMTFDLYVLVQLVRQRHGRLAAEWATEAASAAKWWVANNRRLWRYGDREV